MSEKTPQGRQQGGDARPCTHESCPSRPGRGGCQRICEGTIYRARWLPSSAQLLADAAPQPRRGSLEWVRGSKLIGSRGIPTASVLRAPPRTLQLALNAPSLGGAAALSSLAFSTLLDGYGSTTRRAGATSDVLDCSALTGVRGPVGSRRRRHMTEDGAMGTALDRGDRASTSTHLRKEGGRAHLRGGQPYVYIFGVASR